MILRDDDLRRYPTVFLKMAGLRLHAFAELVTDVLPRVTAAEQRRLHRVDRRRAPGARRHADLLPRDQVLLPVGWRCQYPTNQVLGFLFGVSDATVARVLARVVPVLEVAGRNTLRRPAPGKKRRRNLDALLAETPELAVLSDTFAQRVPRPRGRRSLPPTAASRNSTRSSIRSGCTTCRAKSAPWLTVCLDRPPISRC